MLNLHHGWWAALLAFTLLVYNILRGYLTYRVAPMRDEEERSGYTPAASDYQGLRRLHRAMKILVVVALSSLAFHMYGWMSTTISIPR